VSTAHGCRRGGGQEEREKGMRRDSFVLICEKNRAGRREGNEFFLIFFSEVREEKKEHCGICVQTG